MGRVLIARDPIGVVPLYWGHDREGSLRVASEMKALAGSCADVAQFPPGHWCDSATGALTRYGDCLRANKSMMVWGVEPRVPFLDREFLDVAMRMDARHKMIKKGSFGPQRMEKGVLRQAFDGWLPEEILWRQKEQFSDGVGYGWIDGLKANAGTLVSERELAAAARRFPQNPPQTKEAYWYRCLFERHFPGAVAAETVPGDKSIACSSPAAIAWDASFANAADPSGRAVASVHNDAVSAQPAPAAVA